MKSVQIITAAICATTIGINTAHALTTTGPDADLIGVCCTEQEDQSTASKYGSGCVVLKCNTNASSGVGITYVACDSCNKGYTAEEVTIECGGTGAAASFSAFTACVEGASINPGPVELPCSVGYYGSGGANCTKCPSDEYGNAGTTSGTGATSISECYIPADSPFSDETGSGVYSNDCDY